MFRFLLTRRWLGLLLVVIVLGVTCVELSKWQFHRYYERADSNQVTHNNLKAVPLPVDRVLSTRTEPGSNNEWRTITASGRYDPFRRVFVLYRTRGGQNGVDVVVPFVTASGTAVLVDRGWVRSGSNGNDLPAAPAPPAGTIQITGWVRNDSTNSSGQVTPSGGAVRAISAVAIKKTLPYPTYDGFVDVIKESPSVTPAPAKVPGPDLSGGPSFFYGIQWIFFALLFFGFWGYFAWTEWKEEVARREASAHVEESVTVPE
ncbi:MAG: SURF1 family cytochrome oxidase biogenesis protein [Nocardioidaceae bacterium]